MKCSIVHIIDEMGRWTGSGDVTYNYFSGLGVEPAVGRSFVPDVDAFGPPGEAEEDDAPDPPEPIVITHGLWQRIFGGDPELEGLRLDLRDEGRDFGTWLDIVTRLEERLLALPGVEAMGTPLLEGRTFRPGDAERDEPVARVDEVLVARAWPGGERCGQANPSPDLRRRRGGRRGGLVGPDAGPRHGAEGGDLPSRRCAGPAGDLPRPDGDGAGCARSRGGWSDGSELWRLTIGGLEGLEGVGRR